MNDSSQYQVGSVNRALSILKVLLNGPELMSLTEISRETGLNLTTTYRLVTTLMTNGFLEQSAESGKYRLGVMVLALGDAYLRSSDLYQRAHPKLVELRDECGETVHLSILDKNEIVYLDKLPGLHAIGLMSSRVGGRSPAYCTGVGKVLLAYQPKEKILKIYNNSDLISFTPHTITTVDRLLDEFSKIHEIGYALDQEEHEIGVACVAAPIFGHNGIVAAISVSGPSDRIMKSIPTISNLIIKTADDISVLLGRIHIPHSVPSKSSNY